MGHQGFEAFAVTEAVPAPKLDVFLSYKREERDVAQALASDLITRGYDVWWDAALLAGEDFAKIVHAELTEARAVVVLWSKQARSSHWVRAEAALALANGTLINAVIDGMAFEGIPPEFSTIQAVRLGDDPAAFHTEIAAAIARKGTAPSQSGRTVAEATTTLQGKVKDAEFFGVIANSTHIGDFEEYLDRFGASAQFAGMARRRIATLGIEEKQRRGLARKLRIAATTVAGIVGFMVGLEQLAGIKFSAMLGLDKLFALQSGSPEVIAATPDEAGPTLDDVAEAPPDAGLTFTLPDSLFTRTGPGSMAAEMVNRRDVHLTETSRTSGLSNLTSGEATWVDGATGDLLRYSADITFAWGGTAQLGFQESLITDLFAPEIVLTYVDSFNNGPLAGVTALTGLLADGQRIALAAPLVNAGKLAASLDEKGRSDGSFDKLVEATAITLELAFGDDYGTLEIGKPPGATALRAALFPLTFTSPTGLSDLLQGWSSAADTAAPAASPD